MSVDDFFQIVPATPRNLAGPLPIAPVFDHHLQPSNSSYSLRSHRSISSVGSLDSNASAYSGMTRWSTITGSESVSSGADRCDMNHSRGPSLSIDPKLFRMKEKSPEQVDEMPTAVPDVMKPPPKKRKPSDPDRKKISHARKVQSLLYPLPYLLIS